jgi:hypothetical protein
MVKTICFSIFLVASCKSSNSKALSAHDATTSSSMQSDDPRIDMVEQLSNEIASEVRILEKARATALEGLRILEGCPIPPTLTCLKNARLTAEALFSKNSELIDKTGVLSGRDLTDLNKIQKRYGTANKFITELDESASETKRSVAMAMLNEIFEPERNILIRPSTIIWQDVEKDLEQIKKAIESHQSDVDVNGMIDDLINKLNPGAELGSRTASGAIKTLKKIRDM